MLQKCSEIIQPKPSQLLQKWGIFVMLHFSEIEEICKRTKLKLDPDGRQFTSSRKAMRRGDQKTIEEHRPLFIAALALGTSGLLETTRREIVHNGQYLGYAKIGRAHV